MTPERWGTRLVGGLLDLVFAPVCIGCRDPIPTSATERLVCRLCWARIRAIPGPSCERCWTPAVDGSAVDGRGCRECESVPPSVRVVRSAFVFDGTARALVHALKYRGWEAAAEPMARRMASLPLPSDVLAEARVVVPVPTSPARLRERGYNQAALLAAAFARQTGRALDSELLVRSRGSNTQTSLHPSERRANVAGAFTVRPEGRARARGRHLLLVDDVWTTGATAAACAAALVAAGARTVSVVTFARALPELDR